jgi:hypothetical protein
VQDAAVDHDIGRQHDHAPPERIGVDAVHSA